MTAQKGSAVGTRPVLDASDVADLLRVSVRTVWRLTRTPGFPKPVKLGERLTRWRAEELAAYLGQLQPSA